MTDCYLEQGDQRQPITENKPVSIGSGEGCTLRLGVDGVEEEHVIVRRDGDEVVLQSHVAGEHDVRVNGVAVHAASLEPGDEVAFGDLEATFEMADDESRLVVGDTTHELVRGVNSIGREPEGNVELEHESVSRKHAALLILPSGQILIRDLGSANGTFVNGRRLGEMDLSDGDEIRIGDAVLHLRKKTDPQAKAETPEPVEPKSGAAGGAAVAATVVGSRLDTPDAPDETPSAPKLELEFEGNKVELSEGTVRIGRATDCAIVIDDDALVSRHHAEVEVSGSLVMLRDLDSSNGTRVNGEVIARAQPLNDGDRIGIGGKEVTFSADVPVTPFGQTMVAKDLPGAAGRTVMAPTADAAEIPTDRASALRVLDLGADAAEQQIQQRYRELYSEFQVRLTNAPTAELKATYQKRVDALRAALGILVPQSGAGADSDLPALEPVEGDDGSEAAAAAAGIAAGDADDEQDARTEPATAGKTKAGKPSESGAEAKAKLPKSTLLIGGVAAAILIGVIVAALGAIRASRAAAALQAELAAKTKELQEIEAAIPETTEALEDLAQGKGQLVEQNLELKICNHSAAPLTWVWLNVAQFDAESGGFRSFDTAYDTSWEYLYYTESIAPDSAFGGGRWVVGEERVWDGSALFFAARFEYRGIEVLRAGAMPAFGGDCYPLNLDR